MRYAKIPVIIIISLLLFSGITISEKENKNGDNWSQVGHDARHTYKSSVKVSGNNMGVLWKKDRRYLESHGEKSLIFYQGLLFVNGLYAIKSENGEVAWNHTEVSWIDNIAAGYNTLYVLSCPRLYAFDLNGNLKWKTNLSHGCDYGFLTIGNDKTIYCTANNYYNVDNGSGRVYAIDINGSIKWTIKFEGHIGGYVSVYNSTVYLVAYDLSGADHLYALNSSNGNIKWIYDLPKSKFFLSPPSIDKDGTVYLIEWLHNYLLLAINPNGTLKWKTYIGREYLIPLELAIDDSLSTLYVMDMTYRSITALYLNNGTIKWKHPVKTLVFTGFIIGGDDIIYICGHDGIYAISPNGTQKWHLNIKWNWLSPRIGTNKMVVGSEGILYVITNDGLYAIGPINPTEKTVNGLIIIISAVIIIVAVASIIAWKKVGRFKQNNL